jgi:hypothetical protein
LIEIPGKVLYLGKCGLPQAFLHRVFKSHYAFLPIRDERAPPQKHPPDPKNVKILVHPINYMSQAPAVLQL